MRALENFFKLKENGTKLSVELRAGTTTFLTMMYIVPVNAFILSQAGMPYGAVVTATALVTIISTVLNGLWANTPIAMSVGMGLNAYFTYGLVKGMGIPWETALGIVFISGVVFLLLSLTKFRVWVLQSVPVDLRKAISAGIGAFIAFIGLKGMGIVVADDATFVKLGDLSSPLVLVGILSFLLAIALYTWKIKGAFIIAITFGSVIAWITGIAPAPDKLFSLPSSVSPVAFHLDLKSALKLSLIPVIVTFLITDMFDSVGTLAGVGLRAGLFKDDSKQLQKTLEADAMATTIGALIGTSTTTSFIESAAGVEEGGRTGLTAVITGLLFILTLFLLPVFNAIPSQIINSVLVVVGILMFSELKDVDFSDFAVSVSVFLTVILMPLTYSITIGLSVGFMMYLFIRILQRRWDKIDIGIVILALIGFLAVLLQ